MASQENTEKDKDDLEDYLQRAESVGSGTTDNSADDRVTMDVTEPGRGGPEGEDRPDWDEPGVDTGGSMDPDLDTPSGGNWGDNTGLSSDAAGPDAGDWVSGDSGAKSGRQSGSS